MKASREVGIALVIRRYLMLAVAKPDAIGMVMLCNGNVGRKRDGSVRLELF